MGGGRAVLVGGVKGGVDAIEVTSDEKERGRWSGKEGVEVLENGRVGGLSMMGRRCVNAYNVKSGMRRRGGVLEV